MAKKQPFDEDKNRPGIQAMPTVRDDGRRVQYAPEDPRSRSGGGADPNAQMADALRRYVDAQAELSRRQDRSRVEAEAGSPSARMLAKRRELQQRSVVDQMRKALTAAPAPAAPAEEPKPADPVVEVPTQPTTPATGMPAPPVAVTDPASEISPEEQNARLRARILLMNSGSRSGRLIQTTNSQLGFRSLTGL